MAEDYSTNGLLRQIKTLLTGGGAGGGLTDTQLRASPVPVSVSGGGDASAANQTTIIGHIDGIEAALTTLIGHVDGLEGFSDGLEGLITSTNSLLTTQAGYVDGLETLLTTQAGYLDGVEAAIAPLATETTLAAASAKLPATLGAQTGANSFSIVPASDASFAVTGTFWQATQPISGDITNISGTISLPTGAATETTLAAASAKLPASLGIKTAAASFSIAPASDASFAVTGTFWQATQPISAAALPLPSGAATEAKQDTGNTSLGSILAKIIAAPATEAKQDTIIGHVDGIEAALAGTLTVGTHAVTQSGAWNVTDISGTISLPTGAATETSAAAAATSLAILDDWDESDRAKVNPISGQAGVTAGAGNTDAATQRVVIATDQAAVAVSGPQTDAQFIAALKSGTGTHSSVASGTSSVSILASNAARKGARIRNSDANALHLDLSGGTATVDRAHVTLLQNESHPVDAGYTGAITGIWAADGSGVASVVEFT